MADEKIIPYSELEKYYDKAEVILATRKQVIKDFSSFGIGLNLPEPGANAYHELYDEIYPVIAGMLDRNFEKLMTVLYRIDLNEKEVRHQFDQSIEEDFAAFLSHGIIKRELQKVLIRRYLSS